MGVKRTCSGIIFSIVAFYGLASVSLAVQCNLNAFLACSDLIFSINSKNTCNALNRSLTCFENVTTACGFRKDASEPLCQNMSKPESCDLLSALSSSPITSARYVTPLCKIYSKMKGCFELNCGPTGNMFKGALPGKGSPCPRKVPKECVSPDPKFDTLSKDTCVHMSSSKNCYISRMRHCGVTNLEVMAVDVTVLGFVHTVHLCKEEGYDFTQDGGVCNEIPLDAFLPRDLLDSLNSLFGDNLTVVNQDICTQLHYSKSKLAEFTAKCREMSKMTRHAVSDVLQDMGGPEAQCNALGYTGSGVKGLSVEVISLLAAIFFVIVYNGLRQ